jgi:hypothetical protein
MRNRPRPRLASSAANASPAVFCCSSADARSGFSAERRAASDAGGLVTAARAARRAAGGEPADDILVRFCMAAGCSYDCAHRKNCDFPCRERLE